MGSPWGTHHGSDLVEGLEVLDDAGLVRRLHAGEAPGIAARLPLRLEGQLVKLPARVGFAGHVLTLREDADPAADGHRRALVVAGDHDDADASFAAHLDGGGDLLAGRVQHPHAAHEGQVVLGGGQPRAHINPQGCSRFPPHCETTLGTGIAPGRRLSGGFLQRAPRMHPIAQTQRDVPIPSAAPHTFLLGSPSPCSSWWPPGPSQWPSHGDGCAVGQGCWPQDQSHCMQLCSRFCRGRAEPLHCPVSTEKPERKYY